LLIRALLLLLDIGNTHLHVGIANARRLVRHGDFDTRDLSSGELVLKIASFVASSRLTGGCYCSVVPAVNARAIELFNQLGIQNPLPMSPETIRGVGIRYPRPETIGQDRLANSVAARHHFGAPALVVDFGTAVTFDVVNQAGEYVGGIIAPGLAAMTSYLHEKTALLPRIRVREPRRAIGKNTEEAMLAGAVFGYRGLIRELLIQVKSELGASKIPVIATGGYARLIARKLPEIDSVRPNLTLEGLRLTWLAHLQVPPHVLVGGRKGRRTKTFRVRRDRA